MRGVVVVGVLVLVGLAAAWAGQRRMLFFPSQVVPATAPDDVEEVALRTADGLDLQAWFVPPTGDGALVDTTVVVFHGNGGNRVGRLPLGRSLARAGAGTLLVDYRGYGGNPGDPSAAGLARDARAALDWVHDQPELDPDRVVVFGESLGAAVAVEVAVDRPPVALVLRSPFSSLADIARTHYPVVPGWFLRDRWPTLERVASLDLPVLVVAGAEDRIVPVDQSIRVHEATAAGELVVVDGADHNDVALTHGRATLDAVVTFLVEHLPPPDADG